MMTDEEFRELLDDEEYTYWLCPRCHTECPCSCGHLKEDDDGEHWDVERRG